MQSIKATLTKKRVAFILINKYNIYNLIKTKLFSSLRFYMKYKLSAVLFALILFLNSAVYAVTEYRPQYIEKRLCFAEEIMEEVLKEAAKETLNTVGKHLIKKYIKDKDQYDKKNNENAKNQDDSGKKDS